MSDRPADRIRKLVAHAAEGDTAEARNARAMAHEAIGKIDTELLDTLAGQRARLMEELREESRRLFTSNESSRERATKAETGELVSSALVLFQHYARVDALLAIVLLQRIEDGHPLTDEERSQLDGPREDFLDRWMRGIREQRREQREQRRAARRRG